MKLFQALKDKAEDRKALAADYKNAKMIGVIGLGETYFFFRRGFKVYYVTYAEITGCFRRVLMVSAGSGKGNFQLETLVIADAEKELAQVQVPGADAARQLMEDLKVRLPHADFTCPDKK